MYTVLFYIENNLHSVYREAISECHQDHLRKSGGLSYDTDTENCNEYSLGSLYNNPGLP